MTGPLWQDMYIRAGLFPAKWQRLGRIVVFFRAFHIADLQQFCYNVSYSIRFADNGFYCF